MNFTSVIEENANQVLSLINRVRNISFLVLLEQLNLTASSLYMILGWLAKEENVTLNYIDNCFIIEKVSKEKTRYEK